jgi:hypothetical protein
MHHRSLIASDIYEVLLSAQQHIWMVRHWKYEAILISDPPSLVRIKFSQFLVIRVSNTAADANEKNRKAHHNALNTKSVLYQFRAVSRVRTSSRKITQI